jgi:hypothetical protein
MFVTAPILLLLLNLRRFKLSADLLYAYADCCDRGYFRRVRINVEKWLTFVVCVRLSMCITSALIERNFLKFDIEDFYENLPRNSKFGYSRTQISSTVHEDLNVIHIAWSDMCDATIQRAQWCASVAKTSVFIALLTVT